MRKVDKGELKRIQLEILDDIHAFCESSGIGYSISFGTLIGALRHGGYIPWDDDIDLMMERDDYERFIRTFRSDKCEVLELRKVDWCNELFVKVVRKGTMMKDTVFGRELWGINIDIFPMDMFPADAEHTVCDEIRRKRELLAAIAPYYKTFPRGLNRTRWHLKYIAKRIAKPYFHSILHLKAGIQLEGAAAEGIRKNDVRARSNVFLMDGQKDIGPLHAVKRRGYACRHPLGLEHGAHGTVEKNGPVLGEQFFEAGRHWQPL